MRRRILLLICSILSGLLLTGYLAVSHAPQPAAEEKGISEPACTVAWWSLMYEMPNPEHLPVKVHFWWVKGLE